MFRFRFGFPPGRFSVSIAILFKQSRQVSAAVYDAGYLDTVIMREVKDYVPGVGYCMATQSF